MFSYRSPLHLRADPLRPGRRPGGGPESTMIITTNFIVLFVLLVLLLLVVFLVFLVLLVLLAFLVLLV